MSNVEKINAAMRKNNFPMDFINVEKLKDKEFVYKSKYGGEVHGVIEHAMIVHNLMPLEIDRMIELNGLDDKNGHFPEKTAYSYLILNPSLRKELYHRPEIIVKSTNGVSYPLSEIYIKY